MITITLKDGSKKNYKKNVTVIDVAKDISEGFARNVLSASFNGKTVEVSTRLNESGSLELYSWNDNEGKKAFWHSSSHVLAQALEELYPKIKLTIGPAIKNGFYYDVDFNNHVMTDKDFSKIESKMIDISRGNHDFKMRSVSKKDAINYYNNISNKYKIELINDLNDGEITFCDHSNFTDLCKGGHIPNTGIIKAVKITNVAGAYWRANEKNKQLTRVYGISFPKQKLLSEYLLNVEEAKKRDHRIIGKKLNLFTFSNKVGLGLPLWLPKGVDLRNRLERFLVKAQKEAGYEMVITPHIGSKELYITSGHYEKYGENSFQPIKTPKKGEEFMLKSMNCPHHCEIYNSRKFSYRDLPVRYAEFGTVYRYEQSGELHGLTRVRGFTQDDAHIFCSEEQLDKEFKNVIDLTLHVFLNLGLDDFSTQVSLRDPENSEKYIGDNNVWEKSENAILKAVKEKKLNYNVKYGEAAFYGPKLDFMVNDALGREWQLGTIQVDYNLPERFDLTYKGKDNKLHRPVMIHRAPFGSLERFIAILLENTAGNLPLWLTPNQAIVLPISDKYEKYSKKVLNLIENNEIRALVDFRSETMGRKIRDAELSKIPFMILIGEKENDNNMISLRSHGGKDYGMIKLDKFFHIVDKEINNV